MDIYAAVSENGSATFRSRAASTTGPAMSRRTPSSCRAWRMSDSAISIIWPSRWMARRRSRSRARPTRPTFSPARTTASSSAHRRRGWQALTRAAMASCTPCGSMARCRSVGRTSTNITVRRREATGERMQGHRVKMFTTPLIARDGAIVESHVARDVCFCCKTAVGAAPGGRLMVAWRHIFPESMRDIAMATSTDGGRTSIRSPRQRRQWQLSGCPDDGPAMAIDADGAAHLAWPTLIEL